MFGMQLAGFPGVVRRMSSVAGGDSGVVPSTLGFAVLMSLGSVPVMFGSLFVVIGG